MIMIFNNSKEPVHHVCSIKAIVLTKINCKQVYGISFIKIGKML